MSKSRQYTNAKKYVTTQMSKAQHFTNEKIKR